MQCNAMQWLACFYFIIGIWSVHILEKIASFSCVPERRFSERFYYSCAYELAALSNGHARRAEKKDESIGRVNVFSIFFLFVSIFFLFLSLSLSLSLSQKKRAAEVRG